MYLNINLICLFYSSLAILEETSQACWYLIETQLNSIESSELWEIKDWAISVAKF